MRTKEMGYGAIFAITTKLANSCQLEELLSWTLCETEGEESRTERAMFSIDLPKGMADTLSDLDKKMADYCAKCLSEEREKCFEGSYEEGDLTRLYIRQIFRIGMVESARIGATTQERKEDEIHEILDKPED